MLLFLWALLMRGRCAQAVGWDTEAQALTSPTPASGCQTWGLPPLVGHGIKGGSAPAPRR
jgi:hypothetical protein